MAEGLHEAIVTADVDGKTVLVDGRNRRAACKLAGVEPTVRELDGEDPTAYVLSANVHRRNLSTGQRAMAVAMLRPKTEQGKRTDLANLTTCGQVSGAPRQRITDARAVLKYSGELAKAVMQGEKPLQAALTVSYPAAWAFSRQLSQHRPKFRPLPRR